VTDQPDLLSRLDRAPWHHSPGYNRKADGTRVGKHSYLLARDGEDVATLISVMFDLIESKDDHVWRGQYQGRGHIYRYCTLDDGWTYWHMGKRDLINRDHIDRAEREVVPRRQRNQPEMDL